MHFYIYLPSNVICEHVGNTAATYTVPLNPPIELKHNNFEVALVEISHPSVDKADFETVHVGGGAVKKKVTNKTIPSLMFIYCSAVKGITVGNARVPLLRVCTVKFVKDSANTNTNISFSKPFYQPIACQFIDKIEITISSQTGDPFPFKAGISLACLHFRENISK
jgi:hypothetical protein